MNSARILQACQILGFKRRWVTSLDRLDKELGFPTSAKAHLYDRGYGRDSNPARRMERLANPLLIRANPQDHQHLERLYTELSETPNIPLELWVSRFTLDTEP